MVEVQQPAGGVVVQALIPRHRRPPLGLEPHEHPHRLPVLLPHLAVAAALVIIVADPDHPEGRRVTVGLGVVPAAAAGRPVPSDRG